MISLVHFLTMNHDHILNPQYVSRKDIPLKRHSVSIPAVGMNNGLNPLLMHKNTAPQGAHSHHAIVHIRDNDCVNTSLDSACIGNQL